MEIEEEAMREMSKETLGERKTVRKVEQEHSATGNTDTVYSVGGWRWGRGV